MLHWFKHRRRKRWLAAPFPSAWQAVLEQNVALLSRLSREQRAKLFGLVRVMVLEKTWVGCGGLEMTDTVRITIAAQAGILVLGIEPPYYFDRASTIYVYPGAYVHPPQLQQGDLVVDEQAAISGESWPDGRLVFSWDDVLHDARGLHAGRNVVYHEFAHHLDALDGSADGTPPFTHREQARRWNEVALGEYRRLVESSRREEATLLDHYGASNEAEFFAVATELFFTRPAAMQRRHAELYTLLEDFYQQDPRVWFPDERVAPSARRRKPHASPRPRGEPTATDHAEVSARQSVIAARLDPQSADAFFTRGVTYANHGSFKRAVRAFSEAIKIDSQDGEAYHQRAIAELHLGRADEALADCNRAMQYGFDEAAVYRTRGRAYAAREQFDHALADFDRALAEDNLDADAWFQRGQVLAVRGKTGEAIQAYDRAIGISPAWGEVYLARAHAHRLLGHHEQSRADRDEALRCDPQLAHRARAPHS